MDEWRRGKWAWKARQWGLSAFVTFHLGATLLWVLPPSPLRAATWPAVRYYMMPIGHWQYWGMFAPDPVRNTLTLEADVVDAHGLRATYEFTKVADYSWWQAIGFFRHSKYAANLAAPGSEIHREIAMRHAVRRLQVPDSAFPVDVKLLYKITPTPEPGGPAADPMTPKQHVVIGTSRFEQPGEVRR